MVTGAAPGSDSRRQAHKCRVPLHTPPGTWMSLGPAIHCLWPCKSRCGVDELQLPCLPAWHPERVRAATSSITGCLTAQACPVRATSPDPWTQLISPAWRAERGGEAAQPARAVRQQQQDCQLRRPGPGGPAGQARGSCCWLGTPCTMTTGTGARCRTTALRCASLLLRRTTS